MELTSRLRQSVSDARYAGVDFQNYYGSSFDAVAVEAGRRGIQVEALGVRSILVFTGFGRSVRMRGSISEHTSQMAVGIADDKRATKTLLNANGVPTPYGFAVDRFEEAVRSWQAIGGPVAVKPHNGAQGKGVAVGVDDHATLSDAFRRAARVSRIVLVERFHQGRDYRLFVVDGALVAAVQRVPASVVGDGQRTIEELVYVLNTDDRRGNGDELPMTKVTLDADVHAYLRRQGWLVGEVPDNGLEIPLRAIGSLSQGGHAVDCTDQVHPSVAALAVRSVNLVGLDIAGVDLIATDIALPVDASDPVILEVNCSPGLRAHLWPLSGLPRNPAVAIVDYLFPESVALSY